MCAGEPRTASISALMAAVYPCSSCGSGVGTGVTPVGPCGGFRVSCLGSSQVSARLDDEAVMVGIGYHSSVLEPHSFHRYDPRRFRVFHADCGAIAAPGLPPWMLIILGCTVLPSTLSCALVQKGAPSWMTALVELSGPSTRLTSSLWNDLIGLRPAV